MPGRHPIDGLVTARDLESGRSVPGADRRELPKTGEIQRLRLRGPGAASSGTTRRV